MLRLSANLSFLFTDLPLPERFAAAAAAGFKAVEFMFPYDLGIDATKAGLSAGGLTLQLFNMRAGDWAGGERGIASLEGRDDEFATAVDDAVAYATALGTPRVNCLAGIPKGNLDRARDILLERLAHAADVFKKHGLTLLIENINTNDMPGFFLPTSAKIFDIIERLGRDNIKIQYDVYHAQRMEGELAKTIQGNIARIGHIQVADNPGRHQPGTGEINYPFVFDAIEQAGYDGWIGLEYVPLGTTTESLAWVEKMIGKRG